MNDTRTALFAKLKARLDPRHNPTVRASGADQRMRTHVANLVPARGQSEAAARTAVFEDEAKRVNAVVLRLKTLADVPAEALAIAMEAGAKTLKIAPHPVLQGLHWPGEGIAFGPGAGDDVAGLSMAYAGVAETGTAVLRSGPDTPTTLNFLPDVHMIVLRESDIKASYEEVWDLLRADARPGEPVLPRTVNWITGPSRTADIEQTLLLGAHGPRKLVILLVDEET